MNKIVILISFMFATLNIMSQARVELSELGVFNSQSAGYGKVYFNQPKALNDIVSNKIKSEKQRKAWMIRIYIGSGKGARDRAESIRHGFVAKHPDVQTCTKYPSPYFKVFAGRFSSRIDAESFRNKIKREYPDSRVEYGLF